MAKTRLGIIGCGNIGEAVLKGVLSSGASRDWSLLVADIDPVKRKKISRQYKVVLADDNVSLVEESDVILLAVKPYEMGRLLNEIARAKGLSSKIVISVAAGISLKRIEKALGHRPQVIRAMPNMPAVIGRGITVICAGSRAKASSIRKARALVSCIGDVVVADEVHMDLVTALSGSGPAYFFYLVECLIETAVELGIPKDQAAALVIKTALGSAEVLTRMKVSPEELRRRVTSKGGTTEAAFRVFETKGLKEIIKEALGAARDRARELSES
jgi:pyrroline-5-carboxylate reductase